MTSTSNTVRCASCKQLLDEAPELDPAERKPCPNCGSKARQFSMAVDAVFRFNVAAAESLILPSAPSLLVQAVVVPSERMHQGLLIASIAPLWLEIVEMLANDPSLAFQIGHDKWEEIVAGAYSRAGWDEVTLTPRSGDHGRDVIAIKRGLGSVRVIDQVKAYRPGHLVTADDVRALVGVLHGDGASKGFLTTTSDFAPLLREDPLITPFIPSRLELINGNVLLTKLEELAKKRPG